jgi:hypothetical protein
MLDSGGDCDDGTGVANWLSRMRDAFAAQGGGAASVRRFLLTAMQTQAEVTLAPTASTTTSDNRLTTRILGIHRDGLIVAQPMVGRAVRFLKRPDRYRLSFRTPQGRVSGETKVLGRARISGENGHHLTGYRLSLPVTMQQADAANALTALLGDELAVEAELHIISRNGPVIGLVTDINPAGAYLRCRNTVDDVECGQKARFHLDLPEPVGRIREWVSIADTEEDPGSGALLVRVAFEKRNEAIADALGGARTRKSA